MESKPPKNGAAKAGSARDDRLKAALKANIARRKAQARARLALGGTAAGGRDADMTTTDSTGNDTTGGPQG